MKFQLTSNRHTKILGTDFSAINSEADGTIEDHRMTGMPHSPELNETIDLMVEGVDANINTDLDITQIIG